MHIVAHSKAAEEAVALAKEYAQTSDPILLVGERGTGKDFYARLIARLQKRSAFESVSCFHIDSRESLRRRLAGYYDHYRAETALYPDDEAYTPGLLETAVEGVIYLDRIDLLPNDCVDFIVDILNGDPYTPVGRDTSLEQADVQFIASCAPHPFRMHGYLHHRLRRLLATRSIFLPSLSRRREDIPEFVLLLGQEFASGALTCSAEFLETMAAFDWLGNLHDLRNAIRSAVRISEGAPMDESTAKAAIEYIRSRSAEPKEHARRERCRVLVKGLVYQHRTITSEEAYAWIEQFAPFWGASDVDPRDVAEEILRTIRDRFFYSDERLQDLIDALFQNLLQELKQHSHWSDKTERELKGSMIVTNPLGLMKSPDALRYRFLRLVSGLSPKRNAVEFDQLAEHLSSRRTGKVIVTVDDFLGSGRQFRKRVFGRFLSHSKLESAINSSEHPVVFYSLICVGHSEGVTRVSPALQQAPSWFDARLLVGEILEDDSKAFHTTSSVFPERAVRQRAREIVINEIGQQLYGKAPRGWGDLESLVVFSHNVPNNSLPIIWKRGVVGEEDWWPIFPRMSSQP